MGRRKVIDVDLGPRLLKARTHRFLTLSALSKRTGVSESSLSRFESGVSAPSFADVCSIARALGWPLLFFATGHERTGSDPRHLAAHLRFWGLSDQPADALIGESRTFEEIVLEVLSDHSTPRLVEAVPALLLRNDFDEKVLLQRAEERGLRARVGWACELAEWIASNLHLSSIRPDALPKLCELRKKSFDFMMPDVWDVIGEGSTFEEDHDPAGWKRIKRAIAKTPDLTKKWWIVFETSQERFLDRAKEILGEVGRA